MKRYLRAVYRHFSKYVEYKRKQSKLHLSYRDFSRLSKRSKHERTLSKVLFNEHDMWFTSPFWFLHSVDEIFVQEVYKFSSRTANPTIIDCGANIGLSVVYFKTLYEKAEITAFEADPGVYGQLQKNIAAYDYKDISLINAAVWKEDGELSFEAEGSVGGKVNLAGNAANEIKVPAVRLKDYLNRKIDFLKIDIEGAEYEVLKDCKDHLGNVENLFIEYHAQKEQQQTLHEILQWVTDAGFTYYLKEAWNNMDHPFLKTYNDYFQMQLNIFCYR